MKTSLLIAPLAALLAACQYSPGYPPPEGPYPPDSPYPPSGYPDQSQGDYRAVGTEPFWDLTIGRDMVFTDRGAQTPPVVQPTPQPINGIAGEIYNTPRLNVNIVHAQCSDGMSDRTYPDKVQVRVDGRAYEGCGGPAGFWASNPGEGGSMPPPPPQGGAMLTGTNWRVVAINGRPTPPNGYYLNFQPGRIGARFGCNAISADYTQTDTLITTRMGISTKMACQDMSFERDGTRVMNAPMRINGMGNHLTLSNSAGSIDLQRAD